MNNLVKSLGLVAAMTLTQASFATVFSYEDPAAYNGNTGFGDQLSTVSSTFNDATNRFTWDATFNAGSGVDGF